MHRRTSLVTATAIAALLAVGGCSSDDDTAGGASTEVTDPAPDGEGGDTGDGALGDGSEATTGPVGAGDPLPPLAGDAPSSSEALPDGAMTVVAVGDSLTEGIGDESGGGYPARLLARLAATRPGSDVVNLGRSGWDTNMVIGGGDGQAPTLTAGVDAVRSAVAGGRAAVALVLIGSNDLWYLYEYGPPEGTPEVDEAANLGVYRSNLATIVRELREAGAVVVLGRVDDQSLRPAIVDDERRAAVLPATTADEVARMSLQAAAYNEVVAEVAARYDALVADFDGPGIFTDASLLADDGIHPNGAGYERMADIWLEALAPVLG